MVDSILLKDGYLREGMDQLAQSEARVVLLYCTKLEAKVGSNRLL